MFATGRSAVLLLLATAAATHADDVPVFLQGRPHFYNAVGPAVKVAWTAAPTDLPADAEITLTLTITGATDPNRVRRPDLATMPEFKARFSAITTGNDGPAAPGAKVVTFTYRLRPRDANVQAIPELQFAYYAPGDSDLRTTYFDAIPLKVRSPTPVASPPLPMTEAERFFAIPTEEQLRQSDPSPPSWRLWLALLVVLTGGTFATTLVWRRWNPDGARLARLRRNRAVRMALDTLDAAARSRDPLATAAWAFQTYLAQRFELFAPATVPLEIETALRESNLPGEKVVAAVELCRKFDACRFDGTLAEPGPLIDQARELILRWEGVA